MNRRLLTLLILLPIIGFGQFSQSELLHIDSLAKSYKNGNSLLIDSNDTIGLQLSSIFNFKELKSAEFLNRALERPADSVLPLYFTFALLVTEGNNNDQINESLKTVKTNEMLYGYYKHLISPIFNKHWKQGRFKDLYLQSDSLNYRSADEIVIMQFAITEGLKSILREKFQDRGFDVICTYYKNLPNIDSLNIVLFKVNSTRLGNFVLLGNTPIAGTCMDRSLQVYQDIIGAFINKSKVNDTYFLYEHSYLSQKELFKLSLNKEELKALYKRFGEN